VNETAPETALRATETAAQEVVARVLVQFTADGEGVREPWDDPPVPAAAVNGWRTVYRVRARHVLAALREAGWVDPEEAARLRSDYWRAREDRSQFMGERDEARATKDMHKERAQQAIAERDALLPVVEAAKAWRVGVAPEYMAGNLRGYEWTLYDAVAAVDALDSGSGMEDL
jgi:hypothetical protein